MNPVIVAITYNRPDSLKRLLKSLETAHYDDETADLVISVDHWKDDNPCIKIAEDFSWPHGKKTVKVYEKNLGLKEHVMRCADISKEYGSVILLEDDMIVSPYFYLYAKQASEYYRDKSEVFGIALYSATYNGLTGYPREKYHTGYDTYYEKWLTTWGELIFADRWAEFKLWYEENRDKELKVDSDIPSMVPKWEKAWSKYVIYYMNKHEKWFVIPYVSYATNAAESGVHGQKSAEWQVGMQYGRKQDYRFSDYDNAVKYDTFLERCDMDAVFERYGIAGSKRVICDLHGIRESYDSADYCFSVKLLPYKVLRSFGLIYHPIEQNIIENAQGNDIFLYDLSVSAQPPKADPDMDYKLYRYYYPFLNKRKLIKYLLREIKKRVGFNEKSI
ncbi:MAG: glycosyltransferase family 2 protein [Lachnospiraceae bacterium]|nr:glycosyltransferase family 2 protein [Lachnospiraceae bacterium]